MLHLCCLFLSSTMFSFSSIFVTFSACVVHYFLLFFLIVCCFRFPLIFPSPLFFLIFRLSFFLCCSSSPFSVAPSSSSSLSPLPSIHLHFISFTPSVSLLRFPLPLCYSFVFDSVAFFPLLHFHPIYVHSSSSSLLSLFPLDCSSLFLYYSFLSIDALISHFYPVIGIFDSRTNLIQQMNLHFFRNILSISKPFHEVLKTFH